MGMGFFIFLGGVLRLPPWSLAMRMQIGLSSFGCKNYLLGEQVGRCSRACRVCAFPVLCVYNRGCRGSRYSSGRAAPWCRKNLPCAKICRHSIAKCTARQSCASHAFCEVKFLNFGEKALIPPKLLQPRKYLYSCDPDLGDDDPPM